MQNEAGSHAALTDDDTHVAPCDDGTAYRPPIEESADTAQDDSYALVGMRRVDGTPFLLRVGREYLKRVLAILGASDDPTHG